MRTLTVPGFILDQLDADAVTAAAVATGLSILPAGDSHVYRARTFRPDRESLNGVPASQILRVAISERREGTLEFLTAVRMHNVRDDQGTWINGGREADAWAVRGLGTNYIYRSALVPPDGQPLPAYFGRAINRIENAKADPAAALNSAPPTSPSGADIPPRPSARPAPSPESIVMSTMRAPDIMPGLKAQTTNGLLQLLVEELEEAMITHVYSEEPVPANNEALKLIVETRRRLGLPATTIQTRPVFHATIWFSDPGATESKRQEWSEVVEDASVLSVAQNVAFTDFQRAHPGMVVTGFQVVMIDQETN